MIAEYYSGNICFFNFTDLTATELEQILTWRNHRDIRSMMNNEEIISLVNHMEFIKKLSGNQFSKYWMVKRKNNPCGVVYLHLKKNESKLAEWGYYLSPIYLGSGVGLEVGFEAIHIFFRELKIDELIGFVKNVNIENQRIQKALGFIEGFSTQNLVPFKLTTEFYNKLPEQFSIFQRTMFYGRKAIPDNQ